MPTRNVVKEGETTPPDAVGKTPMMVSAIMGGCIAALVIIRLVLGGYVAP